VFAGAVQIGEHERVFLALEQFALVDDLDPGALGEFGPNEGFKLCPPIGSFPGVLGRELACLIQPQFHGGLVLVDAADHGGV